MNRIAFFYILAGGVLLFTSSAKAQIEDFGVQKSEFGYQTADNTAPSSVANNSLFAYVDVDNHQDESSFSLSDNDTVSLLYTGDNLDSHGMYIGSDFEGSNFYPTSGGETLDQAFTPGDNYTFAAQGGTLDGQSATIPIPSDNTYSPFLYLAGRSFSAAQAINPSADLTLNLALSTFGGAGPVTSAAFSIFDNIGELYQLNFSPGASSITIPVSELSNLNPGEVYTGALTAFNTTTGDVTPENPDDGTNAFANANDNTIGFATTTNFTLVVAPEPNTLSSFLIGASVLLFSLGARRLRAHRQSV